MKLVSWQYSGNEHDVIKGIGMVNMLFRNSSGEVIPMDYRIYHPPEDGKTKNDHFREMLGSASARGVNPKAVVADSWYGSLNNLKFIRDLGWTWVIGLRKNRVVNRGKNLESLASLSNPESTLGKNVVGLMIGVLDVLNEIHRRGVIHVDIKPENCLVTSGLNGHGKMNIIDFGISHITFGNPVSVTRLVGTLGYAAPEIYLDEHTIDPTYDIYSVGISMYSFLVGGDNMLEHFSDSENFRLARMKVMFEKRNRENPTDKIPDEYIQIILKATSQDPRKRYQSAQEMLRDLSVIGAKYPDQVITSQ